ncbi:glycerate kinase [Paraburkholderia hayleyella]|uniref:glycerate kinase n=1 Tax=Paraburkholderia hayleyella TaxID=2152889 RepID=UPI00129108F7|nr:glycerate kinase [Paraburkholderia hayleyella]
MPNTSHVPIIVIAPDSFKGSLSAEQAANAIATGIRRARADAVIRICPMADGGEGTLDALLAQGGERQNLSVRGAAGSTRDAAAGLLASGHGVIETAEIVGITDPIGMSVPVEVRSTTGMGDAIRTMLDAGVRQFFIALGGSSTNDGGAGLLAGLGVRFLDENGKALEPTPQQLAQLARVDISQLDPRLAEASFVAMSDVDNPLTGEHGATLVFGAQKGVRPEQASALDTTLARYAGLLETALNRSARNLPGAGAAGGLGFALHLLGAQFESGAEVVARQTGLDAALDGASWLITGEGRSDRQTLHGKAPFVASQHARAAGVPTTLLSGAVDAAALPYLAPYFMGCFSPAPGPLSLDTALREAGALLANEAEQLTRLKYGDKPV